MPGTVTEEEEVNRVSFAGRVTSVIRIRSTRSLDEQSCRQLARRAIERERPRVLELVRAERRITYDVMVWFQGWLRYEVEKDETVQEAESRV